MPVVVLAILIVYGLLARPLFYHVAPIPLELIFVFAASAAIAQLLLMGFTWNQIQQAIVRPSFAGPCRPFSFSSPSA